MKLGFIVNNLGPSQLAYYLVKNLNDMVANRPELDAVIFYENVAKPCLQPRFAAMQALEAWGYNGVVTATTLSSAERLLSCPSPARKFFYVWDLEWTRGQGEFRYFQRIYGNPKLELIARSAQHASVISSVWNRPVAGIVDDCDYRQFLEIASR